MILGTRSEHREPYLARPRRANPSPVSRRGEAHGAERSPPRRRWESARRRRWRARRRRHQITGERGQQRGHAPRPRRAKFVLVFLAIKKKWSGLWRGGGRKKGGGGEPKALEAGARGHGVLPGGAGRVRMAAVCGRWARGLGPASRVAVACGSCWTSRASAVSAWWGRWWRPDHGTRAVLDVWAAARPRPLVFKRTRPCTVHKQARSTASELALQLVIIDRYCD